MNETATARGRTAEISLFDPVRLGSLTLANRIVMAPLTRSRASSEGVPSPHAPDYYAQRASAGLMIAEATQISPRAGLHRPRRASFAGTRSPAGAGDHAVHANGGRIVLQFWHVGRISHTVAAARGKAPVAPSAIRAEGKTFVAEGFVDVSMPRALELYEIPTLIDTYRQAAANARSRPASMA